jgi:hypothetical protein
MNSPMKSFDPLVHFMNRYGYNCENIEELITGSKYVAVLLKNGTIGLAANLYRIDKIHSNEIMKIDFESNVFRTLYTAYINATVNYSVDDLTELDFFNCIDFNHYFNTVMIGYSEPLVNKFSQINKIPSVFDLEKKHPLIIEQSQLPAYLQSCDCLIMTATTLVNNTFADILRETSSGCDVYLIGPTSPMDASVFFKFRIKAVFGMQFKKFDWDLLELIKMGGGTDKFKKIGKKAALLMK